MPVAFLGGNRPRDQGMPVRVLQFLAEGATAFVLLLAVGVVLHLLLSRIR